MRRILLLLVGVALLVLPSAAAAGAERHSDSGFLVVKRAAGDGGIYGHPVVTVVVQGFVVGRITQEARVDVYHLQTPAGSGAPQPAGPDVQVSTVRWRSFTGKEYSGSDFRFRAIGGAYRVVVRGSGIYLFAGGRGSVTLHGSTTYPGSDGAYSIDGRRFFSLPKRSVTRPIGRG